MVTIARIIAEHVSSVRPADIPDVALAAATAAVCDTLTVACAGSDAAGSEQVRELVRQESGTGDCTDWGSGARHSASGSTLINSFCAGALDFDSLHPVGLVHPAICTVPAAFAVGERVKATGQEVVAAIAIADDLMCRMGLSHPSNRGWYLTALYGGFATAIVAGRLFRHDADRMEHAIGLAFIAATGTQIGIAGRSLAKRLLTAQAAAGGVTAAMLAGLGFQGPIDVFEGRFGLYAMYEAGDPETLLRDLGTRFHNTEVLSKQYPNCGCSHAVLDGLIALAVREDLEPEQVEHIELVLSPYMDRLVGMPLDPGSDQELTAQFSVRYAAAVAVLRRRFTLGDLAADRVRAVEVRRMVERVKVTVDPGNAGGVAPAEVRVTLVDGRVLQERVAHLRGTAENPLDDDAAERKAIDCLTWRSRLAEGDALRLYRQIRGVRAAPDLSTIASLLVRSPERRPTQPLHGTVS